MGIYTQKNRLINVKTPLGDDKLLLAGITGQEAISQLFHYSLDLVKENEVAVAFEKLLGQGVTAEIQLHEGGSRYISGIVIKLSRKAQGLHFTGYTAEIVPKLWLLTKRTQSRIFQQLPIPEILKKVLEGIDCAFELQGTYEARDYCVQYRETDFAFLSRLMEEEGIYYFFKHTEDGHKMVLSDTPQSHPSMPHMSTLIFEGSSGGWRPEERISDWVKSQQLRSGKVTLWDHCFELPHKHLEVSEMILESVQIGDVTHKLKTGGNDKLELYDYPGAYAQRFDGIAPGGGDRAADVQKIFQDNKRTAKIRMEQEAVSSLLIQGVGNYANLTAGHKFTLERHFEDDGEYVVTGVTLEVTQGGNYRSGGGQADEAFRCYSQFTCIPSKLPFRPERVTPRPLISGPQTAVVTGPSGEEIFTDKYSRIKVIFHWDREGKADASSSCWLRVATPWAGKEWGMIQIPRIGQEVLVAFEEGDIDRPIVIGSLYNANEMPPYALPDNKTRSGVKVRSTKEAASDNLNEISFENKKGSEYIFTHAEKDLEIRVKKDRKEWIGQDRHLIVKRDKLEHVERDVHVVSGRDMKMEGSRDHSLKVGGKQMIEVSTSQSMKTGGNMIYKCGANFSVETSGTLYLKANTIVIEGSSGVTAKCGGNFVTINSGGVQIKGSMVMINSGGSALPASAGSLVGPSAVTKAVEALKPGTTAATLAAAGAAAAGGAAGGAAAADAAAAPSHNPNAAENKEKKNWIGGILEDEAGQPVPGARYECKLPDGKTESGSTDDKGAFRVNNIDPGQCEITFPDFDKDAWEPK